MGQRRFLVPPGSLAPGALVELPAEEAAHAAKVLRLMPGDEVWLLDGAGRRARAVLEAIDRKRAAVRVAAVEELPAPAPRLVLCCGLIKAPAMELLAVKLTELMVDEVRLVVCERSVPRPKPGFEERLLRLAAQALKQCGAGRAPVFAPPAGLAQVAPQAPAGAAKLLLYEQERDQSLAGALAAHSGAAEVWLLVGPEGGFAPAEAEAAVAAGFIACGLGPVILRAETAALAAAAVARFGGCR